MTMTLAKPAAEARSATPSLVRGQQIHIRTTLEGDLETLLRHHMDLDARGLWFPVNVKSQAGFEKTFAEGTWADDHGTMSIVRNADDEVAGRVMFERVVGDVDEVNFGYIVYPEFRGHGYAAEALRLFLGYVFGLRRDMNRARLDIHPDNAASIRVAERCGFTLEGRIREGWFNRGQWHDTLLYGLLRRELVDGLPPVPAT